MSSGINPTADLTMIMRIMDLNVSIYVFYVNVSEMLFYLLIAMVNLLNSTAEHKSGLRVRGSTFLVNIEILYPLIYYQGNCARKR